MWETLSEISSSTADYHVQTRLAYDRSLWAHQDYAIKQQRVEGKGAYFRLAMWQRADNGGGGGGGGGGSGSRVLGE